MTHQEYTKKIKEQQAFIRRLFKSRENRSAMINGFTLERYANLVGRFFHIKQEDKTNFPGAMTGYFFISGIDASSDYVMSDRVEVNLRCRRYGYGGRGFGEDRAVEGVHYIDQTFCFSPFKDIEGVLLPLLVERDEALAELHDLCARLIKDFQRVYD